MHEGTKLRVAFALHLRCGIEEVQDLFPQIHLTASRTKETWVQAAVGAAEKAGREASMHAHQVQEQLGEEMSRSTDLDARMSELVASRSVMEVDLAQQKASEAGLKKQLDAAQSELSKLKVVLKQEAARADSATGNFARLQVWPDRNNLLFSRPEYRPSAFASIIEHAAQPSCVSACPLDMPSPRVFSQCSSIMSNLMPPWS